MAKFKVGDKVYHETQPDFPYTVTANLPCGYIEVRDFPYSYDENFFKIYEEPFVSKFKKGDRVQNTQTKNIYTVQEVRPNKNSSISFEGFPNLTGESAWFREESYKKIEEKPVFVPTFKKGDKLKSSLYTNLVALDDSHMTHYGEKVSVKFNDGSIGEHPVRVFSKIPTSDFAPKFRDGDIITNLNYDSPHDDSRICVGDSYMDNSVAEEVVNVRYKKEGKQLVIPVRIFTKSLPKPFVPTFKRGDILTNASCPDNYLRICVDDSYMKDGGEEVKILYEDASNITLPVNIFKKAQLVSKLKKNDVVKTPDDEFAYVNKDSYIDEYLNEVALIVYFDGSEDVLNIRDLVKYVPAA